MTKYNLYSAIGEINEKYIKDVLLEESETYQFTHLSESSSDYERTIVMDVVRKKKRSRIFIAAAVLIITAITVTAVAGLLRKDDNREENNQNSVIKYFTPREIEFPEKLLSVENGYVVGDKFYLVCFYDDDKKTVFTIKDISDGTETIVNTDIEINYAVKSAVSEKCIYIADREKNNNNTYLKAFDINTGALLNEKSLGAVTVTGINTDTENNIIDLFTEGYQNDGLPHTIHMKINADSLETESSSDLTEYIDSSLSVNHSVIKGQKGILIASEKVVTGEIKGIYSFDNEDNFLFSRDDFADNSLPKAAVMMPDGNISLITSENDYDFEIEELNMSSGEFADYFRLKSDEKVIAFKSINLEKYDLIYETENGYYGFTADTESSELIKETGKSGNILTSSSDGKLLFLGQNYNPGNYVQLMDENGQFSENKYRLFFDDEIKNWRRTNNWVADDGTFYCIAADYNDESKVSYLVSTDTQGITEKKKIEVPDKYQGIQNTAMTLAYANGSFYTVVIYEGSNRVCEISPDGKILSVSGEDDKVDYIDNIISTTDGKIIVGYFEKGKSAVSDIMDMAYFEPGDKISENKVSLPAATRIYNGFGKYRYLYANHDGIYGYTAANESEEIINWLDSDVTDGTLNELQYLFFDGKGSVYHCFDGLTKYEPCESTENKTMITIAVDSDDIKFRKEIKDFNKNNEEYRIKLINYKNLNSFSENGMLSSDSLTADLSAGKIPDLIITDSKGAMQLYQDMGMLADLKPFIDNDSEISYDDYFENVFDAFSENGKMYQLCVNFGISGLFGSRETLGEERNWTRDEFLDFAESHDEIFLDATADMLKGELLSYEGFTDFKNHTCSFDSEDFIRILNIIKNQAISEQEHEDRVKNYTETYFSERFVNGNCLVENIEINNISVFDMNEKAYFKNGASFIGNPAANNGNPVINSGMIIGITKKSKNQDIAWEFARRFLLDGFQEQIIYEQFPDSFPVKCSAFEKIAAKAEKGGCSISTEFYDGRLRNTGALKKEDAERLELFIRSANKATRTDQRIKTIVYEETDIFLAGEQTAEEAAENIQKKVKTYLNEII